MAAAAAGRARRQTGSRLSAGDRGLARDARCCSAGGDRRLARGCGKLAVATAASAASAVALAVPEARVIGLPETPRGALEGKAVDTLSAAGLQPDAAVIGPGMQDEEAVVAFVAALWPQLHGVKVVLDA